MREMKDSGVYWIGDIPAEWEVGKTLYALAMPITDGPHETPELFDEGIPFVSAEAVSCGNGRIDFDHIRGFISEEFYKECCKKYIPAVNDIYMIKSGATTGKVALVDTDRIFTIWSPLAVFRADKEKADYLYLYYFLQSDAFQKQVEDRWTYGTQQNIGMRSLEKIMICFPSVSEQRKIASYLDLKCSKIDEIIAKQERIIEKLKAYRLSAITEAVTGATFKGERKSSDLKYVETIPTHWENRKMLSILSMRVVDGPHESPELFDEGIPYISATAIENGKIDFSKMRGYISEEYCDLCDQRYKPQRGDILVIKLGASTGWVAMVETDERFNIWVPLAAVRCNEEAYPRFVYYAFQSDYFIRQMEQSWTYGTQQTLGVKTIERLRILLPPYEEQKAIADGLNKQYDLINRRIEDVTKFMEKLTEYKKSLIYEVVTGKKEV